MLSKIVLLFLAAMAAVALLGRMRFPGGIGRRLRDRKSAMQPAKCPRCGRYLIGGGDCECSKPPKGRG